MTPVRSTLRWMLVLLLLGAAGGGAYFYYVFGQCDELLRQTLLAKIGELAPGWDVAVGRARFGPAGEVIVEDFTVHVGESRARLVEVPQAVIVLDRERFVEKQAVVHLVRLIRPQVWLARDAAGRWNVLGLPPRPKSGGPVVEWRIEQATLNVQLDDPLGGEAVVVALRNVDVDFLPSGKRRLKISSRGTADLAEQLLAEGTWDLDAETWDGSLTVKNLKVGTDLVRAAAQASPAARDGVERLELLTRQILAERRESLAEAGAGGVRPAQGQRLSPNGLGVTAAADVTLRIEQPPGGAPLTWGARATIREGELTHALLPFALYEVQAELDASPAALTVRKFEAHNGPTALSVSGDLHWDRPAADLHVLIRELPFEPRVRDCLTGSIAKIYDMLQISGRCDLDLRLARDGDGAWRPAGTMTVKDSQVTHTSFPLTAEGINGTATLRDNVMTFQMAGRASRQVLTLTGKITNPGPACSAVFEIRGRGLPIDRKFRDACSPRVQAVIDHLRLQGEFDGHVTLVRPSGPRQVYTPYIDARVKNASIQPKSFPYAVEGLTARLEGSGMRWKLAELSGHHDRAAVTAHGSTRPDEAGRCTLDLHVGFDGAALDQPLQAALDDRWQSLWSEFSPTGIVSGTARIRWTETMKPDVDLQTTFADAAISMRSFPFPLDGIDATMSLDDGRLTIESFTAQHDETHISLIGTGDFSVPGEWRVRLENFTADDLEPDRRFRKALPPRVREVLETLDPRGRLSLAGMMEFAGTGAPDDPVTAAWDLEFIHSGTTVTAGVDLQDLFGRIRLQGTWDGEEVLAAGRIDLDSLIFRGHQLTKIRGPLSVNGTQLVIGSKEAVRQNNSPEGQPPVDNADRLTAEFLDGVLALDGIVKLNEQTSYRVKMTLSEGRLERYAELYLPGQQKLMGAMNGTLDLQGKGSSPRSLSGRGRLLISPAALYETPIVVAVFNILKFVPPNKTAFRTASFDFRVDGGKFLFERIQLIGDGISLAGAGQVGFDGNVALDFYSRGGRQQFPIPFVGAVIDEATKGWVRITVRGSVARPQAVVQTMPQMDDALRGLLGMLTGPPPAARRAAAAQAPRSAQRTAP